MNNLLKYALFFVFVGFVSLASAQSGTDQLRDSLLQTGYRGVRADTANAGLMVRIAEIEIHPGQVGPYNEILRKQSSASLLLEPGVVALFPMAERDNPAIIRIVEIYASVEAYQQHLRTPHFIEYKTSTQAMVKSLRLVEMKPIDPAMLNAVFRKAN